MTTPVDEPGGISDDQLPEELQPGDDNPLANPLPPGETADLTGPGEAQEGDPSAPAGAGNEQPDSVTGDAPRP